MKQERNKLPEYNLQIIDGKYPFKNAHINKVFDVNVFQVIISPSQNVLKIIEAINEEKSSLLINLTKLTKIENKNLKINYEYI